MFVFVARMVGIDSFVRNLCNSLRLCDLNTFVKRLCYGREGYVVGLDVLELWPIGSSQQNVVATLAKCATKHRQKLD